jgi:hypothetical protein
MSAWQDPNSKHKTNVFNGINYCKKALGKVLHTRVVEMGIEQRDNIRMMQTHHSIYIEM